MVPRRKQIAEGIDRLRIWIDRDRLLMIKMTMDYPGGDSKTLELHDIRTNVAIDESAFAILRAGTLTVIRLELASDQRAAVLLRLGQERVIAHVVRRLHHLLRPVEHLQQVHPVARLGVREPVPELLLALEVQHRPPPRLAVQLEEALDAQARLPEQVVHVELRPAHRADRVARLLRSTRCPAAASGS